MVSSACPVDAETFKDFIGTIFASATPLVGTADLESIRSIPRFSIEELNDALAKLSNLRCEDDDGVVAEMLKYANDKLKEELLRNSNEILEAGIIPDEWHTNIFRIFFEFSNIFF